jgi:formate dehydrogenase iron-sulfur subunit
LKWLFFKNQCRHCEKPRCKEACPEGVEITEEGFVIFNDKARPENCTKPLEEACPYNVPRLNAEGRYVKCDFCFNRFQSSAKSIVYGKTACELTCPSGAIVTGTVEEIIEEAKNRLAWVKNDGHPNAFLYTGGYGFETHVIWLLTEPADKYGLPPTNE